jgi:galactose mutarotase-like enzyme
MAKHGFARHHPFVIAERADDAVTFRLEADAGTRESYPFEFRLDIRFAIEGSALAIDALLHNPNDRPLPASLGFHPALRWPLPYGGDRALHRVRFETDEPAPIRRIGADQLVRPEPEPTPVVGDLLDVADGLFEDDALIFDRLNSRHVTFGAPGTRSLRVSFPVMPLLGIWTKPGAGFLCIEPWQGIADPEGFTGEFRDKPGVVEVAPGDARRFGVRIDVDAGTF